MHQLDMEPVLDPFLARLKLYVDIEEQLLICGRCGYALAVDRSQVTSHLRDKHGINQQDRSGLTKHLNTVYPHGFRNPAEVPLRTDGSDIHPQLIVYEGFACCSFRTINYHELTRHISQQHLDGRHATSSRIGHLYSLVYLQTWTHGASRRYWIVKKDESTVRAVVSREVSEHIASVCQREHSRAVDQAHIRNTSPTAPTFAGTRPWMERTRWEVTYQGVRCDILQSLTIMPWGSPPVDHILGPGLDSPVAELVSPREDEAKIALLMGAVDHMLDRCEETMQHTGRTLLCWLRSTKPQTCYPKPFTLVALKSSKKKYRQLLKRFFVLIFRSYRIPVDTRRRLTGIRFKKEQLRQIRAIWEHRVWSDSVLAQGRWPGSRDRGGSSMGNAEDEGEEEEVAMSEEDEEKADEEDDGEVDEETEACVHRELDEDSDDDRSVGRRSEDDEEGGKDRLSNAGSAVDELLELVFQLSVTFSTEEFIDSQPSSSLLVYFSGILGLSSDARSFLPARKYTPHLSALIYIQRLLFLEYALPLRPYPHLGILRRSRFQQHQHFDVIRQRYMITGSPTPLEEFQSLRNYGRVIARTDPPSFILRWSDDSETVSYGDDFTLTMESFRGLAEHFLTKAEELCDALMFGLEPEIDLVNIKDNLTNIQYSFSFIQHPANKLTDAYLALSTKACTAHRNGLFRGDR
jgi:Orsellinic acid/F9775 biosynthesis cluster protein D